LDIHDSVVASILGKHLGDKAREEYVSVDCPPVEARLTSIEALDLPFHLHDDSFSVFYLEADTERSQMVASFHGRWEEVCGSEARSRLLVPNEEAEAHQVLRKGRDEDDLIQVDLEDLGHCTDAARRSQEERVIRTERKNIVVVASGEESHKVTNGDLLIGCLPVLLAACSICRPLNERIQSLLSYGNKKGPNTCD
jgi:hypothetical protein